MVLFCNETELPRTVYALCAETVNVQTGKGRMHRGKTYPATGSRSLAGTQPLQQTGEKETGVVKRSCFLAFRRS